MKVKYKHTNIVARNWQALVTFYEAVFGWSGFPRSDIFPVPGWKEPQGCGMYAYQVSTPPLP
ncbi:MAG: hypothetical protein ABIL06_26990 [Pseudomonadota bacterium]